MCVSPPCTRSFALSRCTRRSTTRWRSVCSPCKVSGTHVDQSAFSCRSKSRPCSLRRTSALGAEDAIEPCCCWPCRPDCARRNLPAYAVRTLSWVPVRTCNAWAKDEKPDAPHFAKTPSRCCAVGCENVGVKLLIQFFRPHEAGH